jgi:hypothetical protein
MGANCLRRVALCAPVDGKPDSECDLAFVVEVAANALRVFAHQNDGLLPNNGDLTKADNYLSKKGEEIMSCGAGGTFTINARELDACQWVWDVASLQPPAVGDVVPLSRALALASELNSRLTGTAASTQPSEIAAKWQRKLSMSLIEVHARVTSMMLHIRGAHIICCEQGPNKSLKVSNNMTS